MHCARCQHESPADSLFCQECGAKLEQVCAQCGVDNSPQAKFCRKCGAVLAAAPAAEKVVPPAAPAAQGERRQLTVMFCDLVGSTALSGRLDPEELREVVHAYRQVCAEVI